MVAASMFIEIGCHFNKTVTKIVTILTKYFFPYLNPTSYLNNYFNEIATRFVSRKEELTSLIDSFNDKENGK